MIRAKEDPELQTPMMRQYFAVKEKYPREIVFFRMGDFYEMFFQDARDAADILGITLTSRSKDKDALPMAGVPVRAVDTYLPRLLKAGRRVAICEQVTDPKDSKGLVEREVVRVISPGTITDEKIIGEKANNFIAALIVDGGGAGLAWLDVTTGQFLVWESTREADISAELSRLDPAEYLLPEALLLALDQHSSLCVAMNGAVKTAFPDTLFERSTAEECLLEHFGTQSLEGFGCEGMALAIRAGGGLLRYVAETQKDSLKHIVKVAPYQASHHMPMDRATRVSLELTETSRGSERGATLLSAMDATVTAPGARLLRSWITSPLTRIDEILERQEAVAWLLDRAESREALLEDLRQVHDLERICTRLSYRSASARDLLALRRTMEVAPRIRELLERSSSTLLQGCAAGIRLPLELREEIAVAIVDAPPLSVREGGFVRSGYDSSLDETRDIASQGTRWIARFQEEEIQRTGIPSLKIGYNKVFGYYIEITNAHHDKVPPDYIRKQTLKNCERYLTAQLKEHETKVLHARENSMALEHEIFQRLRDRAVQSIPDFQSTAQALAELDVLASFAVLAQKRGYARPTLLKDSKLWIQDGRHPVVEAVAGRSGFVPNSIDLDTDRRIMIITGPNMAGKSTYIRQVALLTLLAQIGSFLPAREAQIGVVDRIFTRVGASDDLARGQSTFMVEMQETANILNNATSRSLVILDEVGRGTSTFDGVSLAWAITEHLAEKVNALTLFATHYHELTTLAETYPQVRNFNFAVKEWNDEVIFLRKIVEGGSDKSYGIHVARLAGIPRGILERSKEILAELESEGHHVQRRGALRRPSPQAPRGRQLDLFEDANARVIGELKGLDVDKMTPLEALQYLAQVKTRVC